MIIAARVIPTTHNKCVGVFGLIAIVMAPACSSNPTSTNSDKPNDASTKPMKALDNGRDAATKPAKDPKHDRDAESTPNQDPQNEGDAGTPANAPDVGSEPVEVECVGTAGCDCYPNLTCNQPLACIGGICVAGSVVTEPHPTVIPNSDTTSSYDVDVVSTDDLLPDNALTEQLQDKQLVWESFENSTYATDQIVSTLLLCSSGAFGLSKAYNSIFSTGGGVQSNASFGGNWSITSDNGVDVLVLTVTSSTETGVTSLRYSVSVSGGELVLDDHALAYTNPATVADGAAACGGNEPIDESPPLCDGSPEPRNVCETCMATSCCTEIQACQANPGCVALVECTILCPNLDEACIGTYCAEGIEVGVDDLSAYLNCITTDCAGPCG